MSRPIDRVIDVGFVLVGLSLLIILLRSAVDAIIDVVGWFR